MKRTIITVILTLVLTAFAIQAVEQTAFSGAGIIHSTTGGFKFPDGSVQATAVAPVCTAITELPYVITVAGVYCFTGNLETSMTTGNAIEIQADNIVIDLNGWKLDGLNAGSATETKGIYANSHSNITIRNGTIRGFYQGVYLFENGSGSRGHLIENIRVDTNYNIGVFLHSRGAIVRRNQVIDTGGSTVQDQGLCDVYGIYLAGNSVRALENDIINTVASGACSARGIEIDQSAGAVVKDNRISHVSSDTGSAYGVFLSFSGGSTLCVGNQIHDVDNGIYYIFNDTFGKYMDNLTSDVTTPFAGGTPIGIND